MSANILWEPVKQKVHDVDTSSPSSFMEALEQAFGKMPVVLNSDSDTLAVLRGMAAVNPSFKWLLTALDKYSAVRVWAEW